VNNVFLLGLEPPDPAGGRVAQLRFLRDFIARSLLISVPLGVLAIGIVGTTFAALAIGIVVLLAVLDVIYLSWSIRRHERAHDSPYG
jgi:hypothetical protein